MTLVLTKKQYNKVSTINLNEPLFIYISTLLTIVIYLLYLNVTDSSYILVYIKSTSLFFY